MELKKYDLQFLSSIDDTINVDDFTYLYKEKYKNNNDLNKSRYFLQNMKYQLDMFGKIDSISSQTINNLNKEVYKSLEEGFLSVVNLEQSKYGMIFTNSGTDALHTIKNIISFDTNSTIAITTNEAHPSQLSIGKNMLRNFIIDFKKVYDEKTIDKFTDEIFKYINSNNFVKNIIINGIGTTKTGKIIDNNFYIELRNNLIKKLYEINDNIKIYMVLDACQEFSLLNRDYNIYDFVALSAHLCFGPNKLGAVIFKRSKEINHILEIRNLYTESLLDDGHSPYFATTIRMWLDNMKDILVKYKYDIEHFWGNIKDILDKIEAKYGFKYHILYDEHFKIPQFSIAFYFEGVDLTILTEKYNFDYVMTIPEFLNENEYNSCVFIHITYLIYSMEELNVIFYTLIKYLSIYHKQKLIGDSDA